MFNTECVRHHWAPQFRPNTLPASSAVVIRPDFSKQLQPSPLPNANFFTSKPTVKGSDTSEVKRQEAQFFPLSAFLASPDPAGRYPSKSRFRGPAGISTSQARIAAASATHSALTLSKVEATPAPLSCATGAQEPDPGPPLSSTQDLTLPCRRVKYKWSEAARPDSAVTIVDQPRPMCSSLTTSILARGVDAVLRPMTPNPLSIATSAHFLDPQPNPHKIQAALISLSQPSPPLTTTLTWTTPSPSSTVFQRIPNTLITAPVGSLRPFISIPAPQTQPAMSKDPAKLPILTPIMARRKLALNPPSPKVQRELEQFLDLGHANPCWCRTHRSSSSQGDLERANIEHTCVSLVPEAKPSCATEPNHDPYVDVDLDSDFPTSTTEDAQSDSESYHYAYRLTASPGEFWTIVSPDSRPYDSRFNCSPSVASLASEDNYLLPPMSPMPLSSDTSDYFAEYTMPDANSSCSTSSPWILSPLLTPLDYSWLH